MTKAGLKEKFRQYGALAEKKFRLDCKISEAVAGGAHPEGLMDESAQIGVQLSLMEYMLSLMTREEADMVRRCLILGDSVTMVAIYCFTSESTVRRLVDRGLTRALEKFSQESPEEFEGKLEQEYDIRLWM